MSSCSSWLNQLWSICRRRSLRAARERSCMGSFCCSVIVKLRLQTDLVCFVSGDLAKLTNVGQVVGPEHALGVAVAVLLQGQGAGVPAVALHGDDHVSVVAEVVRLGEALELRWA